MRQRLSGQELAPAAALVLWAVVGPLAFPPKGFEPNVWTFVVGVAAMASFALRRRAPLLVGPLMMTGFAWLATLEAFPAGAGIGEVALVLGAYTIEAYRSRGPSFPVAAPAIGAVVFGLVEWGHREELGFLVFVGPPTYVWYGSLIAAGTAAGAAFRDRTAALTELRRKVDALRRAAPAESVARLEALRRGLAAEIEAVVHRLAVRIRPAVAQTRGADSDRVARALDDVGDLSRAALEELRALLMALRPTGGAPGEARRERTPAEVNRDVDRVLGEQPARAGAGLWRRDPRALWIPVALFVAAGVAERLALPPLPLEAGPGLVLEAPEFGEAVAYIAVVVSALVFLLRERAPAAMCVLIGAIIVARSAEGSLNGLQPTRDLLVAAAAFFVALQVRHVATALVPALCAAGGWLIGRSFDPVPLGGTEAVTFAAVTFAAFVAGHALRGALQRTRAAAAEHDDLRSEQAELEARLQTHERVGVARELHDIIGHGLTLLAVKAGTARTLLASGEPVLGVAEDLERDLGSTLAELDRLRAVLGTDDGPTTGEGDSWPEWLAERAAAGGARVDADLRLDPGRLPPGLTTVARRILEEAVTNAHKHGDGRWLRLRAHVSGGKLRLLVENSVGGGPPTGGEGLGLEGIRERARLYGGAATVRSTDETWSVEAVLPCDGERVAGAYEAPFAPLGAES